MQLEIFGEQVSLPKDITEAKKGKKNEWGTFRDSLKAPIHGWFTYPAGFSYKAVEHSIQEHNILPGMTIYDPFMGSGTTNIVAKEIGINSVGVEAHPFVYPITKAKMNWDLLREDVQSFIANIEQSSSLPSTDKDLEKTLFDIFPELVIKCYLPETLYQLYLVRETIKNNDISDDIRLFLRVALIATLRDVSIAATGWPYIAPNKIKITSVSKKGYESFIKNVNKMIDDIEIVRLRASKNSSSHQIHLGDSRDTTEIINSGSVDHIFTSPPYLNNFDYADRTRLEMYFMGDAKNWGDISKNVRTKLMTSATTQISRLDEQYRFLPDFIKECPKQYAFLKDVTDKLSALRLIKGGKKSYDLLTIGYFNDIYRILKDNFRVLKPNTTAQYILGDSAPYGQHIPTDSLIGEIGVAIGFKSFDIEVLRTRGDKWANNPQRHDVMLRESVVTLRK